MRRGILLSALLVAGGLSLAAAGFQARGPQGPNVAEIEKVNDRLYMITGGGGNTAAFITDSGVVLVSFLAGGHLDPALRTLADGILASNEQPAEPTAF